MPISVEFHPPHPELAETFTQVLRDQPDYAAALALALQENHDIAAAHFNGKPVAVAVLRGDQLAWMVVHPATRGRGVGRDFLGLMEKRLGHPVRLPETCRGG